MKIIPGFDRVSFTCAVEQNVPLSYDITSYVKLKTDPKKSSDSTELELVKNLSHPHSAYNFPKTDMNGCKISF